MLSQFPKNTHPRNRFFYYCQGIKRSILVKTPGFGENLVLSSLLQYSGQFLESGPNPHSTVKISAHEEAQTLILPFVIKNCPDYCY